MKFILLIAFIVTSFSGFSGMAHAQEEICADNDPVTGLQVLLDAEKRKDTLCMISARESIIESTFKADEKKYTALMNLISEELNRRQDFILGNDEMIDPVQNLAKGLQDKWFDLYIFKAIDSTRGSTITALAASSGAATFATFYLFKSKGALKSGVFKAWFVLLKDLVMDGPLITRLLTSIGVNAFHSSGSLFVNQKPVPKAPFELLKMKQDQYWSHSEYKMIRDVITYSASTTLGVLAADKFSGSTSEALAQAKNAIVSKSPVPVQKYLFKSLNNAYVSKVMPVLKGASKLSGTTPVSFVISWIVTDVVLTQAENGINNVAEMISERKLNKLEQVYLAPMGRMSDLQLLSAVEDHVSALLWYTAVRSKKAIDELTESEEDFLNDYACAAQDKLTPFPYFSHAEKRARYQKNLRKQISKTLANWESRRVDNIRLIDQTIKNLSAYRKTYLKSLISRLEASRNLYAMAGDQNYQFNSIYNRVSEKLGVEFMKPVYSFELEESVMEQMNCPGRNIPEQEFYFPI